VFLQLISDGRVFMEHFFDDCCEVWELLSFHERDRDPWVWNSGLKLAFVPEEDAGVH